MPDGHEKKARVKIIRNGPYLVSGNVPLSRKDIVPKGQGYEYRHAQDFPLTEEYALCRCGHSNNAPFCDGSHERVGFEGRETASRSDYAERAIHIEGPELDLKDDNRCAYARFCHRNAGTAWELVRSSDDPDDRKEAIIAAIECPSGRLVPYEKDGNPIEPELEPAIEVLSDRALRVSGPLYVKGNMPIESVDGTTYEVRNRVTLCRCGHSSNKPFCDATHVTIRYKDQK